MGRRGFLVLTLGFLAVLGCSGLSLRSVREEPVKTALSKLEGAEYVGSKACADCHEELCENFKNTVHGKIAPYESEVVGGRGMNDFSDLKMETFEVALKASYRFKESLFGELSFSYQDFSDEEYYIYDGDGSFYFVGFALGYNF